jgi:3-oxoisoapionate decarboxylase
MKLGVDCYTLRSQGWNALELIEYSASLGLDVCHFGSENLKSLDDSYLLSLKHRADELDVALEVGMGGFEKYSSSFRPQRGTGEEQLSAMMRAAKVVGSPSVRCLIGGLPERIGQVPLAQHIEEAIRTLKAVAPLARDLGVKPAVENHGMMDLLARELAALVEEAGSDIVGVCMDSGNPVYAAEDPVVTAEVLAPYAVTTHLRDSRVWAVPEGAMVQWAPMGQGNTDQQRVVEILAEKAPNVPINLEILTGMPPYLLPYFDPQSEFWKAYPDMPARDFARFVALARKGEPKPLKQVTYQRPAPGQTMSLELAEALKQQQRRHFEESVAYCRDALGLGENGR